MAEVLIIFKLTHNFRFVKFLSQLLQMETRVAFNNPMAATNLRESPDASSLWHQVQSSLVQSGLL